MSSERILGRLKGLIQDISEYDEEDEYQNQDAYQKAQEMRHSFNELADSAYGLFEDEDYVSVVDIGRQMLEAYQVEGAESISAQSPTGAVAIAEAINLAAKEISYSFYSLKPMLVVLVWKLGGDFGFGEDNAYHLGTNSTGVASFHDPYDEIGSLVLNSLNERIPVWNHGWSGVVRQDDAFNILRDLEEGPGLAEQYAEATSTEDMRHIRKAYMNTKNEAAKMKMSAFLKAGHLE